MVHCGASSSCSSMALFMLLLCCHIASTLGQKPDSALTVVENAEGGDKGNEQEVTVLEEDVENLKVVQPQEQWQTLKPDEAVPAGSHVRLNLQTGQREVKLAEENRQYWTNKHKEKEDSQTSFSADELKQALKKMKDGDHVSKDADQQGSESFPHRSIEELKRDMAELDLLVETDLQIMKRLLDQFNSTNSTTEHRLNILLELEYLVHQVDNAQMLCSMGGLQMVLGGLNSSDSRLQEQAAFVLGSALSSNPLVQVKAVEAGALQSLLTLLATSQPLNVKKKVLFAVASLLRHFPYAQRHFLSHGGLQVLEVLFRTDSNGKFRSRIVTMLYDMISEKELISQAGIDQSQDTATQERLRQYSKVSIQEELLEKGWCNLVPQLLEASEHDHREKALRALLAMAPICLDQYRSNKSLLDSLFSLKDQYQEMVDTERLQGEESDYFAEMIEFINSLQHKME
ncbi:nucleotide exchange factor SIL1 [Genypterus blacodes]|uniref:nucleotide exchange factor SIL1 n=1 Tax=Genypterus blacodes TaxID=154954 RepID=UPI003F763DF7